jgi:phosphopantothenoylcysteine synthetase/decarboxylase
MRDAACGAGPASDVGTLVKLAQHRGWTVQLVATPAATGFIDVAAIESLTGSAIRDRYRSPGESRSQRADAVVVAPATYNTICRVARSAPRSGLRPRSRGRPPLSEPGRESPD